MQRKLGLSRVLDLSATPFFLRGSGYAEGTPFPWTRMPRKGRGKSAVLAPLSIPVELQTALEALRPLYQDLRAVAVSP